MRIVSIDFFRFVFMLQICLWHLNRCFNFMHKGYIAVEFFFILSGLFIYKHSISKKSKGVLDYTLDRIKKFYPPVFIMVIPTLLLTWDKHAYVRIINDFLFISNTGVFGGGANCTLWYLGVLVLGGGLIYAMLKHFREIAISFILPLMVIIIYTYIFDTNNGSLEFWGVHKGLYKPLIRGIGGMALGVILGRFIQEKGKELIRYQRGFDFLLVCGLIGWILIVFNQGAYDRYTLVCSCIIITTCFIETSFINRIFTWKGWSFLGELTLEMYIVHWALVRCLLNLRDTYLIPGPYILICYIITLMLGAYVLKFCSKKLVEFSKKFLFNR